MINAKEAKALYDASGHEVDQFLRNNVEQKVIEAAKAGKRMATVYLGVVEQFGYLESTVTPIHKAVVDKLKTLGYAATFKLDGDKYVPRGLSDDYGNGPKVQNFVMVIGW